MMFAKSRAWTGLQPLEFNILEKSLAILASFLSSSVTLIDVKHIPRLKTLQLRTDHRVKLAEFCLTTNYFAGIESRNIYVRDKIFSLSECPISSPAGVAPSTTWSPSQRGQTRTPRKWQYIVWRTSRDKKNHLYRYNVSIITTIENSRQRLITDLASRARLHQNDLRRWRWRPCSLAS